MLLQILKATRLTIAILLSFYIAIRLGMHSPGWAITSVLVVSLGTIGEIQAKWWQRIVGNFAGGVAAFFMVWWLA
ncbi:MAG: FUSC family protein, partial [Plesiomonas shigelloides]